MTNCKNCELEDEYCASGDCPNDTLTEKWKRGEFIICNAGKCQYYYVQNEKQQEVIKTEYCLFDDNTPNWKILAEVPSYDEWKNFVDANTCLFDAVKMLNKDNFSLEKQNIELKETNEALKAELKEVCDVLIRKCPEMKEWVMMNWKNLYEVQDDKDNG